MTQIHQSALPAHHSVDEQSHTISGQNDQSASGSSQNVTHDQALGTVNISFNAHMRLRAYQDQKNPSDSENSALSNADLLSQGLSSQGSPVDLKEQKSELDDFDQSVKLKDDPRNNSSSSLKFSEQITEMLYEVQDNIVKTSEPGYHYLVNMLNNYRSSVEDPQQLQEIMRKEEFYLSRRKPFMENADFQSYSQVLNQFSNIVERQQYI